MSHDYKDLIKFSPNGTLESNDSHVALSAMSISSPDIHSPGSRGLGLSMNSPELSNSFSRSLYAHTPPSYEFPIIPPPSGYSLESDSISADELRYTKSPRSDPSTEVLGDITSRDSEQSDHFENEMRDAILDQLENYCRKVFVGSVPYGVSAAELEQFFFKFGPNTIDYRATQSFDKCGYAFVIFERASSVNKLLDACVIGEDSTHVILLPCNRVKNAGKFIVIRAWRTSDGYWKNSLIKGILDSRYSVFVGGVPRVCSAVYLAQVFDHEFGNVGKVVVELEPLTGFPKGFARITFVEREAYMNAVNKKHVKLFILKPMKEVEVKPYLESSMRCELCAFSLTDKFCAGPNCHLYICENCWPLHCTANSHLFHTVMCRHENTGHQSQKVFLAQLGFQGTPRHRSYNEMLSSYSNVFTPSSGILTNINRPNALDMIMDNSIINNDYYNTSSTCFGPDGGFRNVADLVTNISSKRNQNIGFHSDHSRSHHHHNSMLHSLPNRRTPISHIIPQDQMQDFSLRVFIGGLPKGINPDDLTVFFTSFGQVSVEIDPNGDAKHVFLHFTNVAAVRALVAHCQLVNDRLTLAVYLETQKNHISVNVHPWLKHNRVWMNGSLPINYDLNATSTRYSIFIGGVPRSTTACELAQVVQSHFGDVALLMIDVDSVFEYPKGSARAVFLTKDVYVRAIQQKFLTVYSMEQPRKVELKPFVDSEVMCENCGRGSFRFFCPELSCLKYYCQICWDICHACYPDHQPLRTRRMTPEERRNVSARQRGIKIVCPPIGYEDPFDFLNAPESSSMSNFDQMNISCPSAPKDFGPIGSGRPN